jgi:hypothetical protein
LQSNKEFQIPEENEIIEEFRKITPNDEELSENDANLDLTEMVEFFEKSVENYLEEKYQEFLGRISKKKKKPKRKKQYKKKISPRMKKFYSDLQKQQV